MTGDASVIQPRGRRGPTARQALDGADLRRWARLVALRLDLARAGLDALNVFPVPDGDTGTNLVLTVRGAMAAGGDDLARSLLVHARGNSGVIASQLVRGWTDVLLARGRGAGVGGDLVAKALRRGDELAWAAVGEPVEGTVLSVSRAAADAAERAVAAGADLPGVVLALSEAAAAALDRTTEQLPALAAAGVVDAGGAGLLVALQALRDVVEGADDDPVAGTPGEDRPPAGQQAGTADDDRQTGTAAALAARAVAGADLDPSGPAYEVMYLVEVDARGGDGCVARLRAELQDVGDSVLVVGAGELWHAHVHTDDPGAAVEAGVRAGTPRSIRITHFAAAHRTGLSVVACAAGAGTQQVCARAGATVVPSAPGVRASTGDVLEAVLVAGARAGRVLVLPNDSESAAVAHHAVLAAEEHGVTAVVARSRSQVQVLAALAVLDGGLGARDAPTALRSVAAAIAGCRYGAVAVAARALPTPLGPCDVGELVGTVGREVVAVGRDAVQVALGVVDRLGEGAELVTVLPGEGGEDVAGSLRERLAARGVAVDVVGGGQPRYLLLLGCE